MSQPTLWGHASRVPGRGWRGAPPPRPPTGPRSRRKSTGCRTAPASTRQLGIRRRLRPTPCPTTRRHGASASRREWGGGWCRFATSAPTTGSVVGSSGAGSWGFEGGRRSPCQAAVFNTAWAGLTTLEWLKPALTDLRHAPPGTARNSVHRAVAGKLLRLVATSLAGGEGESVRLGDGGDLSRAPLSTLPVPLRDGSSSILGDPTARQGALKGEEQRYSPEKQRRTQRPGPDASPVECREGFFHGLPGFMTHAHARGRESSRSRDVRTRWYHA